MHPNEIVLVMPTTDDANDRPFPYPYTMEGHDIIVSFGLFADAKRDEAFNAQCERQTNALTRATLLAPAPEEP